MRMNTFILNTIAFKEQLDRGISQSKLVIPTVKLGFGAIEIRQEYLRDDQQELKEIADSAAENGLAVYLSINDNIIVDGKINPQLSKYLRMMNDLGSSHLKMNIGPLTGVKPSFFVAELRKKLPSNCILTVENNQTLADSKLSITRDFFKMLARNGIHNLHYCFDIANWSWLDATADEAAVDLAPVTTYLHLKNVDQQDGQLTVTSLEEGRLDWRKLIDRFDNVTEYGFEYASDAATLKNDLSLVNKYLES